MHPVPSARHESRAERAPMPRSHLQQGPGSASCPASGNTRGRTTPAAPIARPEVKAKGINAGRREETPYDIVVRKHEKEKEDRAAFDASVKQSKAALAKKRAKEARRGGGTPMMYGGLAEPDRNQRNLRFVSGGPGVPTRDELAAHDNEYDKRGNPLIKGK